MGLDTLPAPQVLRHHPRASILPLYRKYYHALLKQPIAGDLSIPFVTVTRIRAATHVPLLFESTPTTNEGSLFLSGMAPHPWLYKRARSSHGCTYLGST